MGKLNIAHHKSYHPYRRDNIERVRRDEAEAAEAGALQDARGVVADAEARLGALRSRAGLASAHRPHEGDVQDTPGPSSSSLTTAGGHINLFEDLEQRTLAVSLKTATKTKDKEEGGVPLAPSEKDRAPWYATTGGSVAVVDDTKKLRDQARKAAHDPLTSINRQLRSTHPSPPRHRPAERQGAGDDVAERVRRESGERERARALVARRRGEVGGSATPGSGYGGGGGYGDQYNRRDVEEARRGREGAWGRRR